MTTTARGSARHPRITTRLGAIAAVAALAGAVSIGAGVSAGAASRTHASSAVTISCGLVPPSEVKSTLGIAVGSPKSYSISGLVQCHYPLGSNAMAVQISFLAVTASRWSSLVQSYGEPNISGIGSGAFASSISTSPGSSTDLYVYAHGEQIAIGAIVSLAKAETLAKKIVSAL